MIGERDAFTWEAHDMEMLARERDLLEGNYQIAVRYALVSVWDNMSRIVTALAKQRSRYATSFRSVREIEDYLKPQGHPEMEYRTYASHRRIIARYL